MKIFRIPMLLFISFFCLSTFSQAKNNAVGSWITPRSMIKLDIVNDELQGKVTKILFGKKQDVICKKCTGDLKDKPIVGMTVIWGLVQDQSPEWRKGKILDPETGSIYDCSLKVSADGSTAELYVHKSIFGRTIKWRRAN